VSSLKKINLRDLRAAGWHTEGDNVSSLPFSPAGKLQDTLR
jgi:hypothetical protein